MPRVAVRVPAHVLTELRERAEDEEARDALWAQALGWYIERKGSMAPVKTPSYQDRMRSEAFKSARMPRTTVTVPDDLFARADKLAKRMHKTRELLYSEAMAEFFQAEKPPDLDFYGH